MLFRRRGPDPGFRREVLLADDGDELILDHLDGFQLAPRVLLLHGLEGSSASLHMREMVSRVHELGWNVTVLNFRSCARPPGEPSGWIPNRTARLYHSGETEDLNQVVSTLKEREPSSPLAVYGISLGGNVLLKWLGESGGAAPVQAAVSVSVPYDLAASAKSLESPIGLLYTAFYLSSLKRKIAHVVKHHPGATADVDLNRALKARTFFDFDDAAVAPIHQFDGAADYYARSNSLQFLDNIRVPALAISAEDDVFAPIRVLEQVRERASKSVELLFAPSGGHVGFVQGPTPMNTTFWHIDAAIQWLQGRLTPREAWRHERKAHNERHAKSSSSSRSSDLGPSLASPCSVHWGSAGGSHHAAAVAQGRCPGR